MKQWQKSFPVENRSIQWVSECTQTKKLRVCAHLEKMKVISFVNSTRRKTANNMAIMATAKDALLLFFLAWFFFHGIRFPKLSTWIGILAPIFEATSHKWVDTKRKKEKLSADAFLYVHEFFLLLICYYFFFEKCH